MGNKIWERFVVNAFIPKYQFTLSLFGVKDLAQGAQEAAKRENQGLTKTYIHLKTAKG